MTTVIRPVDMETAAFVEEQLVGVGSVGPEPLPMLGAVEG